MAGGGADGSEVLGFGQDLAAVDDDSLAGDVASAVAGEECDRLTDVLRGAQESEGYGRRHCV